MRTRMPTESRFVWTEGGSDGPLAFWAAPVPDREAPPAEDDECVSANGEGEGEEGPGEGGASKTTDEGRWFQYTALGEEVNEIPRGGGGGKGKSKGKERKGKKSVGGDAAPGDGEEDGKGSDDDDDDDDDFETMKTPLERALERRPLLRGTPVMSIFLSRVPVEELRRRYGEQTNAAPP